MSSGAHEIIVEVRDLAVRYGERTVLDGIDLRIRRGEILTCSTDSPIPRLWIKRLI